PAGPTAAAPDRAASRDRRRRRGWSGSGEAVRPWSAWSRRGSGWASSWIEEIIRSGPFRAPRAGRRVVGVVGPRARAFGSGHDRLLPVGAHTVAVFLVRRD